MYHFNMGFGRECSLNGKENLENPLSFTDRGNVPVLLQGKNVIDKGMPVDVSLKYRLRQQIVVKQK